MQNNQKSRSALRRLKQRGSDMLEFTLVLLPFLGFTFLILNVAWAVYTRATLQHAVLQGVRFAVTSQTIGNMGLVASVQTVVQQSAFGQLHGTAGAATGVNGWNNIYVNFYQVASDGTVTDVSTTTGGDGPVNGVEPLVEVSVQSISEKPFMAPVKMPGVSILSPLIMTATAWDRMEAPPLTGVPAL